MTKQMRKLLIKACGGIRQFKRQQYRKNYEGYAERWPTRGLKNQEVFND